MMRLDVFLNTCCIVKRRTEAKRACDNGIVTVDDQMAKASREVMVGQRVCIAFTDRLLEFEVLDVPQGNVARKDALNYYCILRDEIQESEFI
ncbi:MAG: S4 domain-containing protein [Candidatus Latescibacterota bacterium]|jgi:ribosomal 50S subunit-recycling heat shock protein